MDNDQKSQTLHPSPDFKVGDKVRDGDDIGVVHTIFDGEEYPIFVEFANGLELFYTSDGRDYEGGTVCLFRLEESDTDNNTDIDSVYALLQTTLEEREGVLKALREELPASVLVNVMTIPDIEKNYIEARAEVRLLRSLIKGLEGSDNAANDSDTDSIVAPSLQTVNISIEEGTTIPDDGKVSVWQWNKDTYNQYFKANRPVWEFLTSEQVFYLCLFDVITVPKQVIIDNFTEE